MRGHLFLVSLGKVLRVGRSGRRAAYRLRGNSGPDRLDARRAFVLR
jgi:hypothetical protein